MPPASAGFLLYNPDARTRHSPRRENLKSNSFKTYSLAFGFSFPAAVQSNT
jgi:hypothetical protein